MAELFTIRARGYSTEHGEREVGISCIAAPVVDLTGETVAALSVSGTADRMPEPLEGSTRPSASSPRRVTCPCRSEPRDDRAAAVAASARQLRVRTEGVQDVLPVLQRVKPATAAALRRRPVQRSSSCGPVNRPRGSVATRCRDGAAPVAGAVGGGAAVLVVRWCAPPDGGALRPR